MFWRFRSTTKFTKTTDILGVKHISQTAINQNGDMHLGRPGKPQRDPLDSLEKDIEVDSYASLVRSCSDSKSLSRVQSEIARVGHSNNVYLSNLLVQMHAKLGNLHAARSVFGSIRHKNLFTWNIMISAYAQRGQPRQAIELYRRMDVPPNGMTYTSILSACSSLNDLKQGEQIHSLILTSRVESSVILETAIVSMYAKCGRLGMAKQIFGRIPRKTVVSYNALIAAYAQQGHNEEALELYERMDVRPDRVTFVSVLGACYKKSLLEGVHRRITEMGYQSDIVIATSLLSMYAKVGCLASAETVFYGIEKKNLVTWNSMIAAYAQHGRNKEALRLYKRMDLEGVFPDSITFASVLGVCESIHEGEMIHQDSLKCSGDRIVVETALLRMYARLGRLKEAMKVFQGMEARDVVAWNAIIGACSQHGEWHHAIELFKGMTTSKDVKPDKTTFTSILSACANSGALQVGKEVEAKFMASSELAADIGIQNALLNLYAKCGSIEFARKVFDKMEHRDEVSMNIMITAYAQQGQGEESIHLFREMDLEGIRPDDTTYASVLTACSCTGSLVLGSRIHTRIIQSTGFLPNVVLETALVSMYGKCGTLEQSRSVFDQMVDRNSVTWNAILAACAHHGEGDSATELFQEAVCNGIELDSASFVSVLIACSHSGMLRTGHEFFLMMVCDFQVEPVAECYRCMVDLLARSGRIPDAEELMKCMPFEPDAIAWRTVLAACRTQGKLQDASSAAEKAFVLDPDNTAPYILLSSMYSSAGKQDELIGLRNFMKERVLKKTVPGLSAIEVLGKVHEFAAGDTRHSRTEEILIELERLRSEMKKLGYIPGVSDVVHHVEEDEKKRIVGVHSEKLAVGFGLIATKHGSSLRIMKNLRVCVDCHAFLKLASQITGREIVVRDANRFHRFYSGLCSCGDYW